MRLFLKIVLVSFPGLVHSSLFMNVKTSITQDVVWVYSNSTTLTHTDNSFTPIFYDSNIKQAENTVSPTENGIKGVLYSQECMNRTTVDFNLPKTISKIALINGDLVNKCSAFDNILQAQMYGAIGAVIYGKDILNENSIMVPSGTNITIAVYLVDVHVGEELMDKFTLYKNMPASALTPSTQVKSYVRVLLLPASSSGVNPWEVTLLIVSILLVTSFLASVIMHWHIWKKRKRQEYLIEQGLIPTPIEMLPMGKHILEESKLDGLFPTTIVTSDRYASLKEPPVCVVCLEAIDVDAKIRILPCKHEFHCQCIDPWLTSKCAECPLCKYDCYEKQDSTTTTTK